MFVFQDEYCFAPVPSFCVTQVVLELTDPPRLLKSMMQ